MNLVELDRARGRHVGLADHDVGLPAGLQRPHEVRGLGRDVEARPDPQPVERPLTREAFPDQPQDRHLPFGPFDAPGAFGRCVVGDIDETAAFIDGEGDVARPAALHDALLGRPWMPETS